MSAPSAMVIPYKPTVRAELNGNRKQRSEFYCRLWESRTLGSLRTTSIDIVYDVWAKFPSIKDSEMLDMVTRLAAKSHMTSAESSYYRRIRIAMGRIVLDAEGIDSTALPAGAFSDLQSSINRVAALNSASRTLLRLASEPVIDAVSERTIRSPRRAIELQFRVDQFCKGNILLREKS